MFQQQYTRLESSTIFFWSKRAFKVQTYSYQKQKVQTYMHEGHVVVGQKIQSNRSKQKDTHKTSHVNSIGFPNMCFFSRILFLWCVDIRYIIQSNPMSHVHSSTSSNPYHKTNCMISRSQLSVSRDQRLHSMKGVLVYLWLRFGHQLDIYMWPLVEVADHFLFRGIISGHWLLNLKI